jgi:hypothetical protein
MNGDKRNNKNKERRAHARNTYVTEVIYKVMMPSKDEALTQDISEGGLCLMLNRELPSGAILEIKLGLPGKTKPVETLAEVVWQKKTGKGFLTGLKFRA